MVERADFYPIKDCLLSDGAIRALGVSVEYTDVIALHLKNAKGKRVRVLFRGDNAKAFLAQLLHFASKTTRSKKQAHIETELGQVTISVANAEAMYPAFQKAVRVMGQGKTWVEGALLNISTGMQFGVTFVQLMTGTGIGLSITSKNGSNIQMVTRKECKRWEQAIVNKLKTDAAVFVLPRFFTIGHATIRREELSHLHKSLSEVLKTKLSHVCI